MSGKKSITVSFDPATPGNDWSNYTFTNNHLQLTMGDIRAAHRESAELAAARLRTYPTYPWPLPTNRAVTMAFTTPGSRVRDMMDPPKDETIRSLINALDYPRDNGEYDPQTLACIADRYLELPEPSEIYAEVWMGMWKKNEAPTVLDPSHWRWGHIARSEASYSAGRLWWWPEEDDRPAEFGMLGMIITTSRSQAYLRMAERRWARAFMYQQMEKIYAITREHLRPAITSFEEWATFKIPAPVPFLHEQTIFRYAGSEIAEDGTVSVQYEVDVPPVLEDTHEVPRT